jgi:anti-sigma regulatory factor (Ser/Thr protein kinase)
MPAISRSGPDWVARETTSATTTRMARGPTAAGLSRQYVRGAIPAHLSAVRMCDLVLLTSELVTNAVEYSRTGPIDLTVVRGATFTRIEVSNPNESWARAPEPGSPERDQVGGWGLFLVEQLSERWGTSDADCRVWFEFHHPASRERCGFSRTSDAHRSDGDRRKVSMNVDEAHERRRPTRRRGRHDDAP